jgi:hypothetical protein
MWTRKGVRRCGIGIAFAGSVLCSQVGLAQGTRAQDKAELFQAYFDALATEPHTPKRRPLEADRE